jgi:predicted XRE-type DNA-binding protein
MASSVRDHIKTFKANKRKERLVAEFRAERLLSEKMQTLREQAALTQEELVKRLGCPQSLVSELKQGPG